MGNIKEEIKNSKEYIKSLKKEYNKINPTKRYNLDMIEKKIHNYEYYVMGLEYALKELGK